MKLTITLIKLVILVPIISAQISFFDNRFPPAPATRRVVLGRNRQLNGRNAALQQAPVDQPIAQVYEDSQQVQGQRDLDSQEPIVQQPVPTQRPTRNGNGFGQTSVPIRKGNGISRVPQQQQQFEGIGQTRVGANDVSDDVSQREDSSLTDIAMDDVSTERVVPSVTFTSAEEGIVDEGFTVRPEQRPLQTNGAIGTQRRSNGARKGGRKPMTGIGRKSLISTGLQPVGNGRIPSKGRDTQHMTQVVDRDGQSTDQQASDEQLSDGQISGGQTGEDQVIEGQIGGQIGGQTPVDHDRTQAVSGGHDDDGGHHDHHSGDPIQWLRDAIRGEPGTDYPIFYTPPDTGFKCSDQQYPGYYADIEARCQVFHICQANGRSDAFLCPNGTIFSQQHFVCVWWHDFQCSDAQQLYGLNSQLYSTSGATAVESPDAIETTGDRTGDRPVSRPSLRPIGGTQVDVVGGGFGGPADERIQTSVDDSTEGQEQEVPQLTDNEMPSLPMIVDTQEEVAEEVVATTPRAPLRAPNGRPSGGVKGHKNGRRNGMNGGNGLRTNGIIKKIGQKESQRMTDITTSSVTGTKRNGITRKTGGSAQPSIPASPADNARNGLQGTNGKNGGQPQRQRPNGGIKSVFRDRTTQRQELDGQSSSNQWFYFNL